MARRPNYKKQAFDGFHELAVAVQDGELSIQDIEEIVRRHYEPVEYDTLAIVASMVSIAVGRVREEAESRAG